MHCGQQIADRTGVVGHRPEQCIAGRHLLRGELRELLAIHALGQSGPDGGRVEGDAGHGVFGNEPVDAAVRQSPPRDVGQPQPHPARFRGADGGGGRHAQSSSDFSSGMITEP